MKTKNQLQKQYNKIWVTDSYDPWREQLVIEMIDGNTMVIELMKDDKEFYLFPNPTMGMQKEKGLENIHSKVSQLISEGLVADIYIDSL